MHSAVSTEHALHADQAPHAHPPVAQVRFRVCTPLAHGPQACISVALWPPAQTETPVSHEDAPSASVRSSAPSCDLAESLRSESVAHASAVASSPESASGSMTTSGSVGEASESVAVASGSGTVPASGSAVGSAADPSPSSSTPSSLPSTTLHAGVIATTTAQTHFIIRCENRNKGRPRRSSPARGTPPWAAAGPKSQGVELGLRIAQGGRFHAARATRGWHLLVAAAHGQGRLAVAALMPSWHENRDFPGGPP
jgi:hypothetical protein